MPVKFIKSHKRVACGLLGLAVFSFGAVALSNTTEFTSAASDSATINVNVSDGIAVRVLDSTATTDLEELAFDFTPTDAGVSATKNAVVEVATSNETGYKLYVQSDWREDNTSSSGAYADAESSAAHTTSLIHTGAPSVTDTIPTNLATSYPYWYYYNDFYSENKVIPAFGEPDQLAELNEATDGDQTTVPISVGVDTSIVAGAYRNKLVFTAVSNPIPIEYTLAFDANTDVDVSTVIDIPDSMSKTVLASQTSFDIPDSIPTKSKMVLREWNTKADGSGTAYAPDSEITVIADDGVGMGIDDAHAETVTLYAIWTKDFWNIEYMQDMYPTVCAVITTPAASARDSSKIDTSGAFSGNTAYVPQRALYDIRTPGTSYIVRKLADGNCWMVENLRYPLTANSTAIGSKNDRTTFVFSTGSICGGGNTDAACIMNGNTAYDSTTNQYHYTWYAAIAGEGNYDTINIDVDGSICPSGWKLPYSYSHSKDKSYAGLLNAYGISPENNESSGSDVPTVKAFPLSFTEQGSFRYGHIWGSTSGGGWWGSTATDANTYAYGFGFMPSKYLRPQAMPSKWWGDSVRCVAL